jgi:hypothetical protein
MSFARRQTLVARRLVRLWARERNLSGKLHRSAASHSEIVTTRNSQPVGIFFPTPDFGEGSGKSCSSRI